MGTYGSPSYTPESAPGVAPAGRPLTATLAYYGSLAAGVLSLGGAAVLLAQAKDLAQQLANDILGADLINEGGELVQGAIDDASNTLHSRAVIGLVLGGLVVLLALAARKAALWARIVLALLLLAMDGINIVTVRDVAGSATVALDVLAMVASLVAIVGLFAPATFRYARTRKA
jgi:hypothetical protein